VERPKWRASGKRRTANDEQSARDGATITLKQQREIAFGGQIVNDRTMFK
jgi:hypothetical protein